MIMIKFKCLVNGAIAPAVRERVVSGLRRIYAQRFDLPAEALRVEFTEVAPGLWFTAGRPSDASTAPVATGNSPRRSSTGARRRSARWRAPTRAR